MCKELIRQLEVSCDSDPTDKQIDICTNSATPRIYITKFSFVEKNAAGAIIKKYKTKS